MSEKALSRFLVGAILFWFLGMLCGTLAHAQTAGATMPWVRPQFFDNNGIVAAGYKVCTYAAGTTTPQLTYQDSGLVTPNANPVMLDVSGRPINGINPVNIFLSGLNYKFVLMTPGTDNTCATGSVVWTQDNIGDIGQILKANLAGTGGSALIGFQQTGSNAATTTVQAKLQRIKEVADFTGNDFGQQVNRCVAALSGTEGICDATSLSSTPQTCSTDITLPQNTTLRLGNGANISGSCHITITGDNVSIEAPIAPKVYQTDDGTNNDATARWHFTGNTTFLSVTPTSGAIPRTGVTITGIDFVGNYPTSAVGYGASFAAGATGWIQSVTIRHSGFDFFPQGAYKLEDRVFIWRCEYCWAYKNNGPAVTGGTVASVSDRPGQIFFDHPTFATNGGATELLLNGGEYFINGGSIVHDSVPAGTAYCVNIPDAGVTQVYFNASHVHFESCRGTTGGAVVRAAQENGTVTISNSDFIGGTAGNFDVLLVDTTFTGAEVTLGGGNQYDTFRYYLNVANAAAPGIVHVRDFAVWGTNVNDPRGAAGVSRISFENGRYGAVRQRFNGWALDVNGFSDTTGPACIHLYDGTPAAAQPDVFICSEAGRIDFADASLVPWGYLDKTNGNFVRYPGRTGALVWPQREGRVAFGSLPACDATHDTETGDINDSNTNVFGAVAAGGGLNQVTVKCSNGFGWLVWLPHP